MTISKVQLEYIPYNRIAEYLELCYRSRQPVFIHGPPGIGKTALVEQTATRLNIKCINFRLTQMDPVDLRGLPVINNEKTFVKWLPPEELPREGNGILFLDELNLAAPSVQHAAYQLVLQRRLGTYQMPEGWVCFASGNRIEDRAHVVQLPSPLANRFVHIMMGVPPVDIWVEWAAKNGILPEICAFLTYDPESLFHFDPQNVSTAFPTPRSWEFCSRLLQNSGILEELRTATRNKVKSPEIEFRLIQIVSMAVGQKTAADFLAFLEILSKFDPEDELAKKNPSLPKEFRERVAYITCLAMYARHHDMATKIKFITMIAEKISNQLEPELFMLGIHLFATVEDLREVFNQVQGISREIFKKFSAFTV